MQRLLKRLIMSHWERSIPLPQAAILKSNWGALAAPRARPVGALWVLLLVAVYGALGAIICGGLLGLIAWVWKKRTTVEGIGFGDVKLAAAIGALVGMEHGLWAITASAAGGAVLGFILMARNKDAEAPLQFPYGAPLAMAGAGFLLWERWR